MEKYYCHFKGNVYRLVGIAKDSETLAEMVVYQAMYGEGQMWVRPREMFFGEVERDGKRMPRFRELPHRTAPESGCPVFGSCPMRKPWPWAWIS